MIMQLNEKNKALIITLETKHAEIIRGLQVQVDSLTMEIEEREAWFAQYKSEMVIEQRGNVKILQDHIERLSADVRVKEIELAQYREDIHAEYEMKISQHSSMQASW